MLLLVASTAPVLASMRCVMSDRTTTSWFEAEGCMDPIPRGNNPEMGMSCCVYLVAHADLAPGPLVGQNVLKACPAAVLGTAVLPATTCPVLCRIASDGRAHAPPPRARSIALRSFRI
ncbi:MAG: hypothetical protein IPG10_17960 [Flavobacteriales bacterium]|nr:hypothetical protein [Flavobacteriales bacterium]MBK9074039.1 hypothetical protein [Flavobacteriales bacterium]